MTARPSRGAVVGAAITAGLALVATAWRLVWWAHPADTAPFLLHPSFAIAAGVLGVAASAALLLIDRRPGIGMAVVGVLALASLWPPPPVSIAALAVGIVLAVRAGAMWWAVGVVAAAPFVAYLGMVELTGRGRSGLGPAVGITVVLTVVLVVSIARRAARERQGRAQASAEERRRTEAERERVRMARELHDVLAHSLSSISVQANVALHLADRQPERTHEALEGIRDTSRSALAEVRQVLGVLRGDESGPLVPEPDLDALHGIVDDARRLGLDVEVVDALQPRPGAAVQSAIVRIVREALTNAGRHAPGAHVVVRLSRDGAAAVAHVRDDGTAPGREPELGGGTGRGILGMRERATLLGGSLEAGPAGAGFAVAARLPVEAAGVDLDTDDGETP